MKPVALNYRRRSPERAEDGLCVSAKGRQAGVTEAAHYTLDGHHEQALTLHLRGLVLER